MDVAPGEPAASMKVQKEVESGGQGGNIYTGDVAAPPIAVLGINLNVLQGPTIWLNLEGTKRPVAGSDVIYYPAWTKRRLRREPLVTINGRAHACRPYEREVSSRLPVYTSRRLYSKCLCSTYVELFRLPFLNRRLRHVRW